MAGHRIIQHVFIVSSAISAVFGRMEGCIADCCFSPAAKIWLPAVPPLYQHGFPRADQLHTAYDALHFSRNFAGAKRLHAKNGCRHAGFASAAGLYHCHLHHAPVFPGTQGRVRAYPGGGKAAKHSPVRNAGIHGRTNHDVGGQHFGRNCCGSCRKRHRKPMQKDELYPASDWLIMALATLCTVTTIWMGYRL